MIDTIYNSDTYSLIHHHGHGLEIVDKYKQTYWMLLIGSGAEEFDKAAKKFVGEVSPNQEQMDDFIGQYTGLCQHRVVMH